MKMIVTKLDTNKIYYLSHPLTSCGTVKENYMHEEKCAIQIRLLEINNCETYEFYHLIRPLEILPSSFNVDEAMSRCIKLLSACDGIIMSGKWEHSNGCLTEMEYAKKYGLEIIYYEDLIKE